MLRGLIFKAGNGVASCRKQVLDPFIYLQFLGFANWQFTFVAIVKKLLIVPQLLHFINKAFQVNDVPASTTGIVADDLQQMAAQICELVGFIQVKINGLFYFLLQFVF
jgi:hypothetical protein